jgi:hypothetical protein
MSASLSQFATTTSNLKNKYHEIETLFNKYLSSLVFPIPSVILIKTYELAINTIIDSLLINQYSIHNFKPTRVVNLSKKHIYISIEYATSKYDPNKFDPNTDDNDASVTLVTLHITVHPGGKKGIISTPDLKFIEAYPSVTPSGTKGVSAAMKAFVTND